MKVRPLELIALFLLAGTSLLFQVTVTKIFEYSVWANYAYLVISTAMFGLGFSGVLLTRFPNMGKKAPARFLGLFSILCGLGMFAAMMIMNAVPIHLPDAPNGWVSESINVGIVFLALALPFVFFGLVISFLLEVRAERAGTYYFADLIGAGLGCMAMVPLIPIWEPQGLVFFCSLASIAAGFMFWAVKHDGDGGASKKGVLLGGLIALVLAFIVPFKGADLVKLKVHVDKREYSQDLANGKIEHYAYSALSRVDIASLQENVKRVWIAGGVNESNIRRFSGNFDRLRGDWTNQYVQAVTHCDVRILPHLSKKDHTVCMIGTSGGDDSNAALRYGAMKVTGVEMDPMIVKFVTETYKDFAGGLFTDGKHSEVVIDEGRSFLRRDTRQFDVIQQVNNFTPIAFQNGALNLSETYLLTVESFQDFWDSLSDDGILSISRWGTYRLLTTAIETLKRQGMTQEQYSQHIVICKGDNWLKHTMLLKKSPWTPEEVDKIETFYKHMSQASLYGQKKRQITISGILYAPHRTEAQLPAPGKNPYYKVATAEDPSDYYDFGPFNFSPPTDNKPFFNHFKKLGRQDPGRYEGSNSGAFNFAGGSKKIVGRDGITMLPAEVREIEPPNLVDGRIAKGDLPPIIILLEALFLATLFFGFPLFSKKEIRDQLKGNIKPLWYFACLGLGFIFIEIVLIQQLVKFLGHPVYSISAVIGSLLVFAGLGSLMTSRLNMSFKTVRAILWLTAIGILIMSFLLPIVTEATIQATLPVRLIIAGALVGSIGFLMGMPMPAGIRFLKDSGRPIIPWAWAINGYFTVIGSAISVLLALAFGFAFMFYISAAIYFVAPLFFSGKQANA